MTDFIQKTTPLKNTYLSDSLLQSYLARKIAESPHGPLLSEIIPGLEALGERAVSEILNLGYQAEAEQPEHIPYSPWGERIDEIKVSDAWTHLARLAVEEKLIATAYDRKHKSWSRVHQMIRIYLFGPSAALYTCPLAMSDGAARAIELYGSDELKKTAFRYLTSSDPTSFWTSGQWMTEKTGGSDVALTTTEAKLEDNQYHLYGTKWFTSSTTSEMAMTLARTPNAPAGSKGLSLFFLRMRDSQNKLNHIFIHRLKDKLGTKALPTAELTLQGTVAELVGSQGDGIKKIASLFNITRIWNACTAVSFMRRGITLAEDFSKQRFAFGKNLDEHALHTETLLDLNAEFVAGFLLVMKVSELLGKEECNEDLPGESALLRILTPLAKLYTAKQSIAVSSEVLESFGGAGYVEDTHLPRLLRDSQVLSIWEGTTNVLSLDTLRAIQKENALIPFFKSSTELLNSVTQPDLVPFKTKTEIALQEIKSFFETTQKNETQLLKKSRSASYALAETYMSALMLNHCQWALQNNDTSLMDPIHRWHQKNFIRGILDN